MKFLRTLAVAGALSLCAFTASAQDVPPPVHGVTFEEWASAAARISNKTNEDEVFKTLSIDKGQFDQINETFTKALKDDKEFKLITYYGEAFSNLNAGRFAASTQETKRKLESFDDYARVTGHMEAATDAGIDPQKVLEEHGLTVFEYSQDGAYWIGQLREKSMAGNSEAVSRWTDGIGKYKAEYATRYAKK